MELVIDIPEKLYNKMKTYQGLDDTYIAVKHGTPLLKGHGRLIDAGELVDVLNNAQIEGSDTYKGLGRAKELLVETQTIIEADKAESEEV